MTKLEFLALLQGKLGSLPEDERRKSLDFYAEMIEDRLEDGMSEEEAVAELGTADEIAARIFSGNPRDYESVPAPETSAAEPPPSGTGSHLTFLLLASPFLLVGAVVAVSLLVALAAVALSLYAAVAALIAAGLGLFVGGIFAFGLSSAKGCLLLGAGLLCAGLGVGGVALCNILSRLLVRFFRWAWCAVTKKGKEELT